MEQTSLLYFDRSRRRFLRLTGLSAAGLFLADLLPVTSAAKAGPVPVKVDEAVAWALADAGTKVVTHVPATGAVTLFDAHARLTGATPCYAFNEEVAYTMACAAALAGVRSAVIIKSHGLAKAANSVIDSITLGTTAGFVAVVVDDPTGRHSDTVFDSESFLKGTGIPFKKATRETIYGDLLECFLWSEELGIPVALFVDTDTIFRDTLCRRQRLRPPAAQYRRDPLRHVLCPPLARYQQKVLAAKLGRTDWRAVAAPALPAVPGGLPPAWRDAALRYVPVFEVFGELRPEIPFVCGDTGLSSLFAFAPFACVDACSYYGGSLPMAVGAQLAGRGRAWAVTGDYAFLAAGHMGLIEALARRVPLKVLVMDNGAAMATGGQPVPAGVFAQVLNGWGAYVSRIDNPADKAAVREVLTRAVRSERLEIVTARFRG
ncbi:MAG: thiamine pyrophosphate-dependent enzyme [Syntrophales bacterium]